jgi:tetratricopeptide (TPR) repeat protein
VKDGLEETWLDGFTSSEDFDRKGFELCEIGDYESALEIYDEGLALFPFTPELHSGRGHMLLYMGEFCGALEAFFEGLVLSPLDTDLNKGAALALLYLNRVAEAFPHLDRARPYLLDDEHALFELGFGLYQAGRCAESVAYFDGVLNLNEKHTDAHLYRGLALHRAKTADLDGVYRSLEKAQELEPERRDINEHFAHVLFEDGKPRKALEQFERLVPEEVTDETTLTRMLETYRDLGGNRRRRWALRRRLKEIRNTRPVDDLIQELEMDWDVEFLSGTES